MTTKQRTQRTKQESLEKERDAQCKTSTDNYSSLKTE